MFDIRTVDGPVQLVGAGFPRRIGDQTLQSSATHIRALNMQALVERWESGRSALGLDDLDADLLRRARVGNVDPVTHAKMLG
jgi:hypothetical protein